MALQHDITLIGHPEQAVPIHQHLTEAGYVVATVTGGQTVDDVAQLIRSAKRAIAIVGNQLPLFGHKLIVEALVAAKQASKRVIVVPSMSVKTMTMSEIASSIEDNL